MRNITGLIWPFFAFLSSLFDKEQVLRDSRRTWSTLHSFLWQFRWPPFIYSTWPVTGVTLSRDMSLELIELVAFFIYCNIWSRVAKLAKVSPRCAISGPTNLVMPVSRIWTVRLCPFFEKIITFFLFSILSFVKWDGTRGRSVVTPGKKLRMTGLLG